MSIDAKRRLAAAAFVALLILSVFWPEPVVDVNRLCCNAALGVDSGQSTPRAYLLVTLVADVFEVDCNLGTVRNVNDPRAGQWLGHASLLFLWTPREDLRVGADFAVDQNPLRSVSQTPVAVMLGAIVKASPGWDLDVGYQRGLNQSAPRDQWLLGATYRW